MNTAHLDDEQLSASLDGEGGPGDDAHLAGCAACSGRRAELDAVRRALATPGPRPAVGVADRAVDAALAAWAAERASASVDPAPLTARQRATSRPPGQPSGGAPAEIIPLRRRRVPAWALGAAAAVAALLVAVPIVTRDDGGNAETAASAARDEDGTSVEARASGPVIDGGDLGSQDDQLALGRIVESALSGSAGDERALAAPAGEADSAAPAAGTGSPAPAAATAQTTSAGAALYSSEPVCADTVRASYDRGLGPLVYRAAVTWQGTPSELLVYRLADSAAAAGPDHRVFVMALEDCRLLVVQGF